MNVPKENLRRLGQIICAGAIGMLISGFLRGSEGAILGGLLSLILGSVIIAYSSRQK